MRTDADRRAWLEDNGFHLWCDHVGRDYWVWGHGWVQKEVYNTPQEAVDAAITERSNIVTVSVSVGGWVPWNGGECPVPGYTRVQMEFRGVNVIICNPAGLWDWNHTGDAFDIVAYRVLP